MKTNKQLKQRRKPYISQFYRGNHLAFWTAIVASILPGGLNLGISWLLQQLIDMITGVPDSLTLSTLTLLALGILPLILLFHTMVYLSKPRFIKKAMGQYKDYAFQKLTRKSMASFQSEETSRYLSAFSNDAASIESGYLENQFLLVYGVILFLGAIAMMLAYNPLMTLVACGFSILPVVASLLTGNRVEKAERKISEKNSSLVATLKDSLSGFSVVKSFKAESPMISLFGKRNREVEDAKCEKRKLTTILSTCADIASVTAQLGTFLVGAYLAMSGLGITPGVLLIFIDLTAYVIIPVRSLPEQLASRKAAIALIDKLADALETNVPDEGVEIPNRLQTGIALRDVSFGYEPEKMVLRDITTEFKAGKSYAIVGGSGSGKSTLLNLLMASHRTYTGEIRYDGLEGREISCGSLYDVISLIQQNVFVFNASIRDNITMFRQFPREAVDDAIRKSGLADLISRKGEDYLCGENGSGLSGGEKQRISIARSLLRKSPVLLVDEATASLDPQTANQVSGSILDLESVTRIVVTHSLDASLLKRYDRILAMKNGRIVEAGTFDDLMTQKGYFYSLYTVTQ